MMPGQENLPPLKPEKPKVHPGGDCECDRKYRRIQRTYWGYGFCGHCGKLTPFKLLRIKR